ncbi:MAG TPA: hypothetical protein VMT93_07270 [Gemmatimonadaceae bacterium]|nr:hypothetical protein [Gemmatimonadaceae bacterium]
MRLAVILTAAAAIAAAAACSTQNVPSERNFGVLNIKDTTNGGSGYKISPTGVFWVASNLALPNSTVVPDSCIDTLYYPPDTTTRTITTGIDAGSPIQFATSTGTGSMTPDTIPGKLVLYKTVGTGVTHTPGTDVTFAIPGAAGGFEAVNVRAKTAALLSIGPVDPNPVDSIHLTWNLQTPGTTAVNFALLYMYNGSSKYNRQILCSFIDDGDGYVDKKTAAKWKASYPNQTVQAYRWVTTFVTGSNNSLVEAISEFDTVKTVLP